MDDETIKQHHESVNLDQQIKKKAKSNDNLRSQILAQDQWKQEVLNSLLQIRRKTQAIDVTTGKPANMVEECQNGIYLQDFIRLEDDSGTWKPVQALSREELDQIKSGGICNEEGAKFVIGVLDSLTNNNIALSNMSEKRLLKIQREAMLSLRRFLINNRKAFDIDSIGAVHTIMSGIIRPNMTANFSKAKNGQFVSEILREIRMVGSMDDEEDDEDGWRASLS